MKKKNIVIIALIILILIVLGVVLISGNVDNKSDEKTNTTVNNEKGVTKDQIVDGLKLENTSLIITNGISTLETTVINNTGKDYELKEFTITIKDKDDKVITTIPGYVGGIIKDKETKKINSSVDIDLSNARKVEYSIKK